MKRRASSPPSPENSIEGSTRGGLLAADSVTGGVLTLAGAVIGATVASNDAEQQTQHTGQHSVNLFAARILAANLEAISEMQDERSLKGQGRRETARRLADQFLRKLSGYERKLIRAALSAPDLTKALKRPQFMGFLQNLGAVLLSPPVDRRREIGLTDHAHGRGALLLEKRRERPESQFETTVKELQEKHYRQRLALAKELEPIVNAYVKSQPQENIEQFRDICIRVGDALRSLELGAKCPKTGKPAAITAVEVEDGTPRFRIRRYGGPGTFWRKWSDLELIPDEPRLEGKTEKLKATRNDLKASRGR